MLPAPKNKIYEFEEFRLVPDEGLLLRNGTPINLNPKAFAVLAMLVERNGHLVSKGEILDTIWEGSFIEEGAISKAVWFVRNALGDTSKEKFIRTVPRRGYRFVAPVTVVGGSGAFRLSELPGVDDNAKEFVSGVRNSQEAMAGTYSVIDIGTAEHVKSESSNVMEVSPDLDHENGNDLNATAANTRGVDPAPPTTRRKGFLRGLKYLLWGLGVWFAFMVLLQALLIFGAMLVQYEHNLSGRTANPLVEMIGDLLVMVLVPVGLAMFAGIGLTLFGSARMVYSLFEKEGFKTYSAIFERVITVLIILGILAVAVPNLIFSYREANKARQIDRAPTVGKRSIAVLPLKPLHSANRDEIYEVGIADSLIQQLSAAKGLVVRPLSALRKYTAIDQDPLAAGREQRVDYVLASNYQLADGKIRISAQVINVASGEVEETVISEKDAKNVFSVQDAVANDIGNRLLARFGSGASDFRAKRGTDNQEAYRLYMMGMNLSEERGVQNVKKALEYLERAVEMDPTYAVAWAGVAHLHRDMVGHSDPDAKGHYEKSMEAISKALAIDPNLSEAYSALCHNKNRYEYDSAGAETACKRALDLDPNSPQAHKTYANFLYSRGRFDEAMERIKTAMDLQPVSYQNQQIYGLTLFYARRFPEAEAQFKRLLELNPNHNFILGSLVTILEVQGKESEAFQYLIKNLIAAKTDKDTVERFKTTYARSGWKGVTQERIKSETRSFHLACLYTKMGDKDKAFEYLDKAYRERSFLIAVLQVAPQLDPLRDDPRYADLVRQVEGN